MSEQKKRKIIDLSEDNSTEDSSRIKLIRSFSIIQNALQKSTTQTQQALSMPAPISPPYIQIDCGEKDNQKNVLSSFRSDISDAFLFDNPKCLESAFNDAAERNLLDLYHTALVEVIARAEIPDINPGRNKVFCILTAQARSDPKITKAVLKAVDQFLLPKEIKSKEKLLKSKVGVSYQKLLRRSPLETSSFTLLNVKAMLAFKEKFKQVVFFSANQLKLETTENRETLSLSLSQN